VINPNSGTLVNA
jgi:aubergine